MRNPLPELGVQVISSKSWRGWLVDGFGLFEFRLLIRVIYSVYIYIYVLLIFIIF